MNDSSGFKVIKPGVLSLLQDSGRFGHHQIGLTSGGPMDPLAFHWANRLCQNPVGATAIEISLGGLVLEAQVQTQLAVTGAELLLKINGKEQELWQSHCVEPGDRIELGATETHCRAYLAVTGGFTIAPQFGSAATVVREGLGGLHGTPLQTGDWLPCAPAPSTQCFYLPGKYCPVYLQEETLRVIPGYQYQMFSRGQRRDFFSNLYQVSNQSDRMGYRLSGPEIKPKTETLLSEGICLGAIQLPADGQPVVLMQDRQTIGGYPKMGSVLSIDLAYLGQLLPGAEIRFEPITLSQARLALQQAQAEFSATNAEPC